MLVVVPAEKGLEPTARVKQSGEESRVVRLVLERLELRLAEWVVTETWRRLKLWSTPSVARSCASVSPRGANGLRFAPPEVARQYGKARGRCPTVLRTVPS